MKFRHVITDFLQLYTRWSFCKMKSTLGPEINIIITMPSEKFKSFLQAWYTQHITILSRASEVGRVSLQNKILEFRLLLCTKVLPLEEAHASEKYRPTTGPVLLRQGEPGMSQYIYCMLYFGISHTRPHHNFSFVNYFLFRGCIGESLKKWMFTHTWMKATFIQQSRYYTQAQK